MSLEYFRKHPYNGVFGEYFYDTPKSRTQYYVQSFLAGAVPLMDGYYRARDNTAYMDDYMKNRGLDWSDIKYPSNTVGWSGGHSAGSTVRSVSKNVMSLYKDDAVSRAKKRADESYRAGQKRGFLDGRYYYSR